jgi:hypothetical protein
MFTLSLGERILRMKPSRFEPMNRMTCEVFSLAPIGGEGWGEGAIRSASRFMERSFIKKFYIFFIAPPLPDPLLHCVEERESVYCVCYIIAEARHETM